MASLGKQLTNQIPGMLWCLVCCVCIGLLCLYIIILNRFLKCGCDGGCGEDRGNKNVHRNGQLTTDEKPSSQEDYMKLLLR